MTVKEFKNLLDKLPSTYDNYIVVTEEGHQGFDGYIIIDIDLKKINIS